MSTTTLPSTFRDPAPGDSDSDADRSDASRHSLSPTRAGLSKTQKRKERRQFGAFADALGDALGAAFGDEGEGVRDAKLVDVDADKDKEMQIDQPTSGVKMSKRQRQNLAKMQARRLAKEQAKMITTEPQPVTAERQLVTAERKGMTIRAFRGPRPEAKRVGGEALRRRRRKERERERKRGGAGVEGEAMDVE
ncbi:hypothetical protein EJ07DRAFT_180295 [Lizonia empirigonia]|nr:hypothetical protein EJ07DRAFT_180295 [Lizonia empirigonia]